MANFIGWFSRFNFNDLDGSDYPYNDMARWLHLPPQIEIWSDNLSNTEASYVSFTLHAPSHDYPIPEPPTILLFDHGGVRLILMRPRSEGKFSVRVSLKT